MIRNSRFVLLCAVLWLAFAGLACAEGILFFSPSRVLLSDRDKVEVVTITNQSDFVRAYKIDVEDLIMTPEGVTASVETFPYSARRMIRFVPRQFTLKPGEKQAIRIMSRVGGDVPDGDYHTHLRFLEDVMQREALNEPPPGQASITAPLSYEALIPVILSHGNIDTAIGMKDVRVNKNSKTGEYTVFMNLTRQGNGQGTAYIDTDYILPDGSAIKASVRRTVFIYRELDERKKEYNIALPEGTPRGGQIKVTLFDNPGDNAVPVDEITIPFSH